MARATIERSELGQRTKIGQGGQGVVYKAPKIKTKFADSLVYKEYKAPARDGIDFDALAAMPDLVENSLSYADGERLISMAAWPCAVVEDRGTPTGFVMPEIPEEFFVSLTTLRGVSCNMAEFQHLLNPESVLNARGIALDEVQRYSLLREVASALAFLHGHAVCVGDISPKNLLFSLEPREAVYFIDCDAMRINDVSALPQVETPGWEVPPGEELGTVYSDAYKLALLALRLLAGDQDLKTAQHIPATVPTLLRGLITDTLNRQPQKRPLPDTWTYILGQALEEAQHRKKAAAPAPPAARAADSMPPPSPPLPSQPWSAPPRVATSPSGKMWAGIGVMALAAVVFVVFVIALFASRSGSGSTASTNQTTYTTSYSGGYGGSTSYPTTATTSSPSPFFGTPPNVLQGADGGGDYGCNGGHPLPTRYGKQVLVAPAAGSADGSYTSCGFAIRVGQAYLDSNPDYMPERRISVASPKKTAGCLQIRSGHPGVQCDGNNFWMVCQREGPDQATWIACRGGNNAVVYIWG